MPPSAPSSSSPIVGSNDEMSVPRAHAHFIIESDGEENDTFPEVPTPHRSTSNGHGAMDSPPQTPRTNSFGQSTAKNPFSPPASVLSFSTPTESPMQTPAFLPTQYPFPETAPRSGITSLATSMADLRRTSSSLGSHPQTAESQRASYLRSREAFTSPPTRPLTLYNTPPVTKVARERPKSTMLTPENAPEKPWVVNKDRRATISYFVTYGVAFLGIVASGLKIYFDWKALPVLTGNLCSILDEDFSSGNDVFGDNGVFFREVDMSGFGNGQFEMTTSSLNNSFVQNNRLYILPTLTEDSIGRDAILNGHVYNITDCTYNITRGQSYTDSSSSVNTGTTTIGSDEDFDAESYYAACSAVSNFTTGQIINPIQSARISTRSSANIRYGKVEVRAKIPTGDWMWPAIWMLPVDNTYGDWPLSGEIDIMESRGNGISYPRQGSNYVRGSLNWGPVSWYNAVAKTYGWWTLRRGSYADDFHTYSIEWTDKFMRIYVDTRLHHMFQMSIKESFWDLGEFPSTTTNGSETIALQNPWVNGSTSAPFDQRFYLILNVAIGGTNGWFEDGYGDKPWLDGSSTAMRDFYNKKDTWYATWPEDVEQRAFVIDSVKMWERC
ncbi:GH16 beta-1,3-glucan recognition protein [Desarmillaria tabescens]|uniref:GH16 beta-1,3-glucan recognition protein n=1 Tax=Armillaria tabescens TaxID=1929756 RepID=A0AA39T3Y5_ARMTA|nr:GH16 beta-1,3-glucan recognition protein [Desarmillaria tabescens]KAK0462851.1 GH16 beta-1,3-glucan recognition protein [Desarmillaria tabescens]